MKSRGAMLKISSSKVLPCSLKAVTAKAKVQGWALWRMCHGTPTHAHRDTVSCTSVSAEHCGHGNGVGHERLDALSVLTVGTTRENRSFFVKITDVFKQNCDFQGWEREREPTNRQTDRRINSLGCGGKGEEGGGGRGREVGKGGGRWEMGRGGEEWRINRL